MASHNLTLTPAQIGFYKTQGYLLLRADEHSLLEPTELQQWAEDIRNWPREKGKWMPYDEIKPNGERQLMRTENFVDYHPGFQRLLCGGEIENILAQLTGDVSNTSSSAIRTSRPSTADSPRAAPSIAPPFHRGKMSVPQFHVIQNPNNN